MTRAAIFLFASCAFAQFGASTGASAGTPAGQLPLSGRTGQTGSVVAAQSTVPGTTGSINTINPSIQVSGPFAGSAGTATRPRSSKKLSLQEAVQRGLQYNLGAVGMANAVRQARGRQRVARSSLLPNLNGYLRDSVQQLNLKAQGLGSIAIPFSGFSFPTVVGPFDYFDLRATLTQTVADMTALNNYRSAKQVARANQYSAQDARDLVALAVGGAYLQVIAAKARLDSARAQLETANALYKQSSEQRSAGLVSLTDVNRSQIEALIGQQRLASIQNDLAKQKINLARLTGLPANGNYEISDTIPFSPAPSLTVDDALKQAFDRRPDLKAASAQIRAAELARSAARAERLPSLSVSADYGAIGTNPSQAHGTFSAAGTLRFPIWQGGRTEGDIAQAEAALDQRKAELQDLRGRIESEVRNAYLDLTAASSQVEVARKNLEVTKQTLDLTRQRFEAGVTDNVEVVQAQESVANAELDYINSVFAHNVAKLSLARAMGGVAENLPRFLKLQ